ncbi:MAG: Saccharopine dehydrogenase [NADP(+), L-glutamate-forming] [Bathelium mastoideum]|nr:MAG: Saccharopine dehydrogenase [NADP(+), L-glutamate-forming] [Bathelium mastoideum]
MESILPSRGSSKKVLLLGAGFVTRPTAQILSDKGISVTVGCRTLESSKKLAQGLKNAHPISVDVNDEKALDQEVAKVDLVISLIPYSYHVTVVKSAIRNKKHVVTTSYTSPAMMELDAQAKEAGITVLNEIGLDPGIDHLYAIKTIHEVHQAGGKIKSFLSYCGGLPAPEASGNPLGYKFSWSARGALLASTNTARFYEDGKVSEVPGTEIMNVLKPYFILPGFAFWAYPNRDSTPYKERYAIPEASQIIRGTLRYQGFAEFFRTLVAMGFLSTDPHPFLQPSNDNNKQPPTWAEATAAILGTHSSTDADLLWAISSRASFASTAEKTRVVSGLRWLDLLSPTARIEPRGTPLDTLCATLEHKCAYGAGERDMVMLQHRFEIEHADGRGEVRTSTLCDYGDPKGYSSMARLVGTPCAVAVLQVLEGKIAEKGVLAPMSWELCEPLLRTLKEEYGIELTEEEVVV